MLISGEPEISGHKRGARRRSFETLVVASLRQAPQDEV